MQTGLGLGSIFITEIIVVVRLFPEILNGE